MKNNQNYLRTKVKLAKALNDDWSYKDMSQVIDINANSFYNWLNGSYQLSKQKLSQLESLIDDLMR